MLASRLSPVLPPDPVPIAGSRFAAVGKNSIDYIGQSIGNMICSVIGCGDIGSLQGQCYRHQIRCGVFAYNKEILCHYGHQNYFLKQTCGVFAYNKEILCHYGHQNYFLKQT